MAVDEIMRFTAEERAAIRLRGWRCGSSSHMTDGETNKMWFLHDDYSVFVIACYKFKIYIYIIYLICDIYFITLLRPGM